MVQIHDEHSLSNNRNNASFRHMLNNAFGINTGNQPVSIMQPPEGYEYFYDQRGQLFMRKKAVEERNEEDVQAEQEHQHTRYPLNMPANEIENTFGIGIRLYFNFCSFLIMANFALFFLSLIVTIPHYISYFNRDISKFAGDKNNKLDFLFISTLQVWSNPYWITYIVLSQIFAFLLAPWYSIKTRQFFIEKNEVDDDDCQLDEDTDNIQENEEFAGNQKTRLFISFIIFISSLSLPVLLTYVMLIEIAPKIFEIGILNQFKYAEYIQIILAAGCSGIVSICNVIWKKVCFYLTKFEKHKTYSSFRRSNLFKLVLFKVASLFALYTVRYIIEQYRSSCLIYSMGIQYLLLFLLEITFNNFSEIFLPKIMNYIEKKRNRQSDGSDYSKRPEFDTAEEYLELIYRQYMIYISMAIFPLVTLIGCLANMVEIKVDKYRLFKLCKKPPRTRASNRKMLIFYLMLMWFIALLTPPSGAIYFGPSLNLLCHPCIQYDLTPADTCYNGAELSANVDWLNLTEIYNGNHGSMYLLGISGNIFNKREALNGFTEKMDFADLEYWNDRPRLKLFVNSTYRTALEWLVSRAQENKSFLNKFFNSLRYSSRCKCRPCVQSLHKYIFDIERDGFKGPYEVAECYALDQLVGRSGICWRGALCPSGSENCRGNDDPWKADSSISKCSTGDELVYDGETIVKNSGPCNQRVYNPYICNSTRMCTYRVYQIGSLTLKTCEIDLDDSSASLYQ